MDSRRDFIKRASLLGAIGLIPPAIQRALAIEPKEGTTFLDAEHVVILMQENRSFDHLYGSLQGVRGFNDPRVSVDARGIPVWLQSNSAGDTYGPFRLDIKDTNSTWTGCLPHSWSDQTDTLNHGWHDQWLDNKASGFSRYAKMPLTMGYHTREDLPFYYALADAFTICDQNFCSSLTGTTPNRCHLWTGTIRGAASVVTKACVRNSDVDTGEEVSWTTFPERLQSLGISWKVYQNELYIDTGLGEEKTSWLGNFGDNPLEYFTQYRVRMAKSRREFVKEHHARLLADFEELESGPRPFTLETIRKAARLVKRMEAARREMDEYTQAGWEALSSHDKELHSRAFTLNTADPHYRELETLNYKDDDGTERSMQVPKGDVLHQFRKEVNEGKLPAVSWLVAPQVFSDHPDSPWYGAWYIAEVLDILTRKPEVWQKTIFILCYDENDGYYDHIAPFTPPNPADPSTGKASEGLHPELEHVTAAQEAEHKLNHPKDATRTGPIGLGYRVPLVIASPWSRGGRVYSEVCDHTSILRLLEVILSHRTGKRVREDNISPWRRNICGDLTSVFRGWPADLAPMPASASREQVLTGIHRAKFRPEPSGFNKIAPEELEKAKTSQLFPRKPEQEVGTRPACALPYQFSVNAEVEQGSLMVTMRNHNSLFKERAAGVPLRLYSLAHLKEKAVVPESAPKPRSYALKPGDQIVESVEISSNRGYRLQIFGPNGFWFECEGSMNDPEFTCVAQPSDDAQLMIELKNSSAQVQVVHLADRSYGSSVQEVVLQPLEMKRLFLDVAASAYWYDVEVTLKGVSHYTRRFAGHVETGSPSTTDPLMGRVLRGI